MTRVKGCPNELCASNHDYKKFDVKDNFCPKCGQKLVEVCKTKKCYRPLTESDGEYCHVCQDKKDKRKEKVHQVGLQAKKVGEQAIEVAPKVLGVVGLIKKIKK